MKKSGAMMLSACWRENFAPAWRGAGSSAAARSTRLSVLGETLTPSFLSSPTIRW